MVDVLTLQREVLSTAGVERIYPHLIETGLPKLADGMLLLAIQRDKLFELISECDAYLDTNNLTQIGSGSILHQKMKDISTRGNTV